MREIKFRYVYKYKETNAIILKYWLLSDIEENGLPVHYNESKYQLIARDEFINLHDKNVKEIYKGDIVCVPSGYSNDCYYPKTIAVVDFDAPSFYLMLPHTPGLAVSQFYHWEEMEVIGNIHENPELLK